jgi:hypothetical protein
VAKEVPIGEIPSYFDIEDRDKLLSLNNVSRSAVFKQVFSSTIYTNLTGDYLAEHLDN